MQTKFLRMAAWLLVALLVLITVGPVRFRPETGASASLERFAAFALVTAVLAVAYPARRLQVALLMISFAASLEILQLVNPGRHGRTLDFLVKAAGAGAGGSAVFVASYVHAALTPKAKPDSNS